MDKNINNLKKDFENIKILCERTREKAFFKWVCLILLFMSVCAMGGLNIYYIYLLTGAIDFVKLGGLFFVITAYIYLSKSEYNGLKKKNFKNLLYSNESITWLLVLTAVVFGFGLWNLLMILKLI